MVNISVPVGLVHPQEWEVSPIFIPSRWGVFDTFPILLSPGRHLSANAGKQVWAAQTGRSKF